MWGNWSASTDLTRWMFPPIQLVNENPLRTSVIKVLFCCLISVWILRISLDLSIEFNCRVLSRNQLLVLLVALLQFSLDPIKIFITTTISKNCLSPKTWTRGFNWSALTDLTHSRCNHPSSKHSEWKIHTQVQGVNGQILTNIYLCENYEVLSEDKNMLCSANFWWIVQLQPI